MKKNEIILKLDKKSKKRLKKSYIGLGSNLNQPIVQILESISRLSQASGVYLKKQSSLYRSNPHGPQNQPAYINAVVEIDTYLSADSLLDFLQDIERFQKRVRNHQSWGPRTIDLDILLFGNERIENRRLIIPHPRLSEREFVVYPLAEITEDLRLPSGESIQVLKSRCPLNGMEIVSY